MNKPGKLSQSEIQRRNRRRQIIRDLVEQLAWHRIPFPAAGKKSENPERLLPGVHSMRLVMSFANLLVDLELEQAGGVEPSVLANMQRDASRSARRFLHLAGPDYYQDSAWKTLVEQRFLSSRADLYSHVDETAQERQAFQEAERILASVACAQEIAVVLIEAGCHLSSGDIHCCEQLGDLFVRDTIPTYAINIPAQAKSLVGQLADQPDHPVWVKVLEAFRPTSSSD